MATLDLTADAHKQRMPTSNHAHTFKDRFRARWDFNYVGLAVLCTDDGLDSWTVTAYPGTLNLTAENTAAADEIFYGRNSGMYFVSNGLAAALLAAGYTLIGGSFASGFDTGFNIA